MKIESFGELTEFERLQREINALEAKKAALIQRPAKWIRADEHRKLPPFFGEIVYKGHIQRRVILSYTTLEAAIGAANWEGFNRITNGQGECAVLPGGKLKL